MDTYGKKGENKELKKYHCSFCSYDFEQYVGKIESVKGTLKGISSQVRCAKCLNFLKTWEES